MPPPDQLWFAYKRALVYSPLFDKGIVAATTSETPDAAHQQVTQASFHLGGRNLFFYHPQNTIHNTEQITPNPKTLTQACALLQTIVGVTPGIESFVNDTASPCIFNPARRDEIFLPIAFKDRDKELGLYVYPWVSEKIKDTPFQFSGFDQYVTAGCLFGSSLIAIDQYDACIGLLKHDIHFFPGQKIVKVRSADDSPYEKMLFNDLEKQACLIDKLSARGGKKELLYHLPYYDYVIFGIQLFIHDLITQEALNLFFSKIFTRKTEHEKKITEIFSRYGITVDIQSPFKNMFPSRAENLTQFITNIRLVFTQFLQDPGHNPIAREKNLITFCCQRLISEQTQDILYRQVWKDLLTSSQEELKDIEDLFRIANSSMILVASKSRPHYRTCSLLPLSEKPIQVHYARYSAQNKTSAFPSCPAVINLTTVDSVAGYFPTSSNKNGLMFYFYPDEKSLVDVMVDKMLLFSSRNIVAFARGSEPTHLSEDILETSIRANNSL